MASQRRWRSERPVEGQLYGDCALADGTVVGDLGAQTWKFGSPQKVSMLSTSSELRFQSVQTDVSKQFRSMATLNSQNDADIRGQLDEVAVTHARIFESLTASAKCL
jgi:hypothetical protein